jgi:hypothetical protein
MALTLPATATRVVVASRAEEEHAQTHAQFFGCGRTIAAAHQDRVVVLSAPLGPCHSAAKGSATGFTSARSMFSSRCSMGPPHGHDLGSSVGGVRRLRVLPLEPPSPLVARPPDAWRRGGNEASLLERRPVSQGRSSGFGRVVV